MKLGIEVSGLSVNGLSSKVEMGTLVFSSAKIIPGNNPGPEFCVIRL